MGIIIGKFRKKKNTYDVLEKLESEINKIEEYGKNTEQTQKRIVARFLIYAILIYFILIVALYFYYYEVSTNERMYCLGSIVALPFMIWIIKILLTWYYSRKLKRNEKKLVTLKETKRKMLDNVMETETYKVAKKILEKFGNDEKKPSTAIVQSTPMKPSTIPFSSSTAAYPLTAPRPALRQRFVPTQQPARNRLSFGGISNTPSVGTPNTLTVTKLGINTSGAVSGMSATPLPLPRSVLPRDRSILDKMVDYLVGDGPSNRYALICKQCSGHNGMALKEEFEYLSFKCCYCSFFNPALKKKPIAPKLEFALNASPKKALPLVDDDTSDSEKNSSSDTDSDGIKKPVETDLRSDSPDVGKMSDFDKLSDLEQKNSDTDTSPLNLDSTNDDLLTEQKDGSSNTNEADFIEPESTKD